MTREVCEAKIVALLAQIEEVYQEYMEAEGVKDNYLSLAIVDGGFQFNNTWWEHEEHGVIEYY